MWTRTGLKTHTGIRDITLGMELLAYEYTFGYPYIIPYVEVIPLTGDEDDKLGNGKTDAVFGASVARRCTMRTITSWTPATTSTIKTAAMKTKTGYRRWQGLSGFERTLAPMAEAGATSEDIAGESGILVFPRRHELRVSGLLSLSWFGGGAVNSDEDGMGATKVGYLF